MGWTLSGCEHTGWYAIDHVVDTADVVTELDLRFEYACPNSTTPTRGQIHYVKP